MGGFVPGGEVAGRRGTRVIVRPRFILWFLMAEVEEGEYKEKGGGGGGEGKKKIRRWRTKAILGPVFSKKKKKKWSCEIFFTLS